MPEANQYTVRQASLPRDRDTIIGLWHGNLGDPDKLAAKFSWFYLDSPTGPPFVLLLESGRPPNQERVEVGVATAGLRRFLLDGQALTAGVLVDLAVLPKHRTLFPAILLQKTMLRSGLEVAEFLYGFPNPKAAPVFKRAGYRHVADMVRYVRVLRSGGYLKARLPSAVAAGAGTLLDLFSGLRLMLTAGFRAGVELEWCNTRANGAMATAPPDSDTNFLCGARSEEFLRWRFGGNAERICECVNAYATKGRSFLGRWIVEADEAALCVRDCSVALLTGRHALSAWRALFRAARQAGYVSVSFECVGPHPVQSTLRRLQMLRRSRRPVYMAARPELESRISAAEIYLTAGDEDE